MARAAAPTNLDITLTSGPDRLTIEAAYEGGPFDPVKDAPPPVLTGALEDRPVGAWAST